MHRSRISISTAATVLAASLALAGVTTAQSAAPPVAPPEPCATAFHDPAPVGVTGDPNDLLAKVQQAGVLVVATDPNYKPQSFLQEETGTYVGFDIDMACSIANALGVAVQFEPPDFSFVEAGSWAGRFDVSVGSMTITDQRLGVLDFTQPYYYTPAQMGAVTDSGITTLDGLAGKSVCTGDGTTYYRWLTGTLTLADKSPQAPVPEGVQASPLKTDQDCAQSVQSGRRDFQGWLTSITTLESAIADGIPFVKVGDPVFYEPLGIAFDKAAGAPAHAEILAAADKVVTDMHADGRLSALSLKWFDGVDYTTK